MIEREHSVYRQLIHSVATKFLVMCYATLCHAMIQCNTLYYVMSCVMLRYFMLYDVVLHFCYVMIRFGMLYYAIYDDTFYRVNGLLLFQQSW